MFQIIERRPPRGAFFLYYNLMNIIFSLIQHVQTWKSWEKGLLWAAVFIHLATAGIAISRRAWLTDDSIQYLLIADHIQQGSLSQTYAGEVLPDTQRTPGYPFFLILTGGIPWVILGLQHLLCFLSGYFIYKIFGSVR